MFSKFHDSFLYYRYEVYFLRNIITIQFYISILLFFCEIAYYASGTAVRAEGPSGAREAFVLLNRCLDLAEAADDDSAHLLDYTDFGITHSLLTLLFVISPYMSSTCNYIHRVH